MLDRHVRVSRFDDRGLNNFLGDILIIHINLQQPKVLGSKINRTDTCRGTESQLFLNSV